MPFLAVLHAELWFELVIAEDEIEILLSAEKRERNDDLRPMTAELIMGVVWSGGLSKQVCKAKALKYQIAQIKLAVGQLSTASQQDND